MIPNCLINCKEKTLVLFDMDGVCAEFKNDENAKIIAKEPGIYLNKRPIISIIKVMEQISRQKMCTVGILSSCECESQKKEKELWLNMNIPFLNKENIFIIVWDKNTLANSDRNKAKINLIMQMKGYDKYYLFEDKHSIIKASNQILPNTVHHLSELID